MSNSIIHSLRHLREAAGITQTAAHKAVGISGGHLSEIERGSVSPRLETVEALLALYGHTLIILPVAEQSELTAMGKELLVLLTQAGHDVAVSASEALDAQRLQQLERAVGRYWELWSKLGMKG